MSLVLRPFAVLSCLVAASACATQRQAPGRVARSATVPVVESVSARPGVVDLSGRGRATAEVTAIIRDPGARIADVRLRFVHAPIELKMVHAGGEVWRAKLDREQLEEIAVAGQTTQYEADVIARSESGKIAVSNEPVSIAIRG